MFDFDICAPHVTIPECVTDENSVIVVFDLGRLQFRNLSPNLMSTAAAKQKQSSEDDGKMLTSSSHIRNNIVYNNTLINFQNKQKYSHCVYHLLQ